MPITPLSREELILSNQRLAYSIALRVWKRGGCSRDFEEMQGEAMVALVKAADTFDPSRGFAFGSYLGRAIENYLYKWLARDNEITENHRKKIKSGEAIRPRKISLIGTGGGKHQDEDYELPLPDTRGTPEDSLIAEDSTPIPGIGKRNLLRWLKMKRCTLTKREKQAIRLRVLKRNTVQATATKIGCSKEWVRKLVMSALPKVKDIGVLPELTGGAPRSCERIVIECRWCGAERTVPKPRGKTKPRSFCEKRCLLPWLWKHRQKLPPRDELIRLYVQKRRSTVWLARQFGVADPGTVRKALLKYGVQLRGRGEMATYFCIEPGCSRPAHKIRHAGNGAMYGTRCKFHRKLHYAELGKWQTRKTKQIPPERWRYREDKAA